MSIVLTKLDAMYTLFPTISNKLIGTIKYKHIRYGQRILLFSLIAGLGQELSLS